MAQLAPVNLPIDTWVNLYTATGLTVGTKLTIQNLGDRRVILVDSASQPAAGTGYNVLQPYEFLTTAATPSGVWAKASTNGKLQVEAS